MRLLPKAAPTPRWWVRCPAPIPMPATDTFSGLGGNDVLDGGTGADTMRGGTGDDRYYVDDAGGVVIENAGEGNNDVVWTGMSYVLGANVEQINLTGTADVNGTGNALINVLAGNSGNNILDGGANGDTLIGLGGNDTYVVDDPFDIVIEAPG